MLNMQIRVAETRPVASFELQKDEILADRVREELKKAFEAGDISGLSTAPTIPAVAVFEEGTEENPIEAGSIALFSASGKELTGRDFKMASEENAQGTMTFSVTGTDEEAEDNLIGVFFEEDTARIIGALWKAGVLG